MIFLMKSGQLILFQYGKTLVNDKDSVRFYAENQNLLYTGTVIKTVAQWRV